MKQDDSNQEGIFSTRIRAGKRTYFIDVKATKSGKDYYVVITESRRVEEDKFSKQKIFLYKEDFRNFLGALSETIDYVENNLLIHTEESTET